MAVAYSVMNVGDMQRAAIWWRMQGFPVPVGTPDDALGKMGHDGMVTFVWALT